MRLQRSDTFSDIWFLNQSRGLRCAYMILLRLYYFFNYTVDKIDTVKHYWFTSYTFKVTVSTESVLIQCLLWIIFLNLSLLHIPTMITDSIILISSETAKYNIPKLYKVMTPAYVNIPRAAIKHRSKHMKDIHNFTWNDALYIQESYPKAVKQWSILHDILRDSNWNNFKSNLTGTRPKAQWQTRDLNKQELTVFCQVKHLSSGLFLWAQCTHTHISLKWRKV